LGDYEDESESFNPSEEASLEKEQHQGLKPIGLIDYDGEGTDIYDTAAVCEEDCQMEAE
jgi:hypothetical protein